MFIGNGFGNHSKEFDPDTKNEKVYIFSSIIYIILQTENYHFKSPFLEKILQKINKIFDHIQILIIYLCYHNN